MGLETVKLLAYNITQRKNPPLRRVHSESVSFDGHPNLMKAVYHSFIIPRQELNRQPDTLMSLYGRNEPVYQKIKLEFPVKMRRPLTAGQMKHPMRMVKGT